MLPPLLGLTLGERNEMNLDREGAGFGRCVAHVAIDYTLVAYKSTLTRRQRSGRLIPCIADPNTQLRRASFSCYAKAWRNGRYRSTTWRPERESLRRF